MAIIFMRLAAYFCKSGDAYDHLEIAIKFEKFIRSNNDR